MKKFNPEKSIGLVLDLDDFYRPSNQRQQEKITRLFGMTKGAFRLRQKNLESFKLFARKYGYKIFTHHKAIQ